MIKVTKHTSNICGCVTWFQWNTEDAEGSRVVTDIAISPCQIHNPVHFGKTLLVDEVSQEIQGQLVIASSDRPVEIIADVRPEQILDIIPLSVSVVARVEMHLQEGSRAVLLQVPEISEDELNSENEVIGRKFRDNIDAQFSFDEDRKLIAALNGAGVSDKEQAFAALVSAELDTENIIIP